MKATTAITAANYEANLASLWALAALVDDAPISEMLAAAGRADSIGHIVDPTLYRRIRQRRAGA